jgi:sulfite reductase (NADPH) flavoprotein alpha-component
MNSSNNIPETAPFSPEQARALETALNELAPNQRQWLAAFLGQNDATAAPAGPKPKLTVLYGSESGNSETLASDTAKSAKQLGFKAEIVNMSDTTPEKVAQADNLLVLVSTWGEGDPPETAIDFHTAFMAENAPSMKGTRFSVLGLGDTSYEHFCKMGKDFDAQLESLGGERIFARADCDVDYDDTYSAWVDGVLGALVQVAAPANSALAAPAAKAPEPTQYSRKNPFPAELKERVLLNGQGSAKETIHLEFDLEGSGLQYKVGDSLAVIPHNAKDVVDAVLETSGLDPAEKVSLKEVSFTLLEALTSQLDLTALSKPVLNRYNEIAQNKELDGIINDSEQLKKFIEGRDLADLMQTFPATELKAQALVESLRKLPPRLYSIASSLKAHEEEVHLTVGVVRYDSHGRARKGVCSTFLADRIQPGETAGVFVTQNKNFKLPDDPEAPIIMVGPGTGIAPFRAFIEERSATEASGKNWLFFGDQHYQNDFLYQLEWQDYLKDGLLTKLDVAFSRDQPHKIYVQDRMNENSKELYQWLEAGAYFYVCGDASRMAHDVDKALHAIVAKEGKLSEEAAVEYVKALKSNKRYLRDVY